MWEEKVVEKVLEKDITRGHGGTGDAGGNRKRHHTGARGHGGRGREEGFKREMARLALKELRKRGWGG
jgi:hypothetical protein